MMQEEIDYLINEKVAKLAKDIHKQENSKFEKLQQKFGNCSIKTPDLTLERENERLKTENSMLKQTLEDSKSREISYKALLPTSRVVERYHSALQQKANELIACQMKIKDLKIEKEELTKAYICCKTRAELLDEEKNEAVLKQEFAERRCEELTKIIHRTEVGIGIDNNAFSKSASLKSGTA